MSGLPSINIIFQTKAATLIDRSAKGIVALIIRDDTDTSFTTKEYYAGDIIGAGLFTAANKAYIEQALMGSPTKVIVERLAVAAADDTVAFDRLKNKTFNYIAVPAGIAARQTALIAWVKARRDTDHKSFKAVVANAAAAPDHEGIINFCTSGIVVDATTYSADQYVARIAGILAGLPYTRSATYFQLTEVSAITESATPGTDIDAGKLILINDVGKIKIARGVNSFTTFTVTKSKVFRKIKTMEAVDLMSDDIRQTFNDHYIGKIINSYDNKQLFFAAVNYYFTQLEKDSVLDDNYDNNAQVDFEAQRSYLEGEGVDVDALTTQQIKEYNTQDQVFAMANVKILDAMEDLYFNIYM